MKPPRDAFRSRLYDAERSAWTNSLHRECFGSVDYATALDDTVAFLAMIQSTSWWRTKGYRPVRLDMNYSGRWWSRGGRGQIHLARATDHWGKWVVLHEVAHAVQPDGTAWHGREFCHIYVGLVERFIGKEEADLLRAAMRSRGLKYSRRRQLSPEASAAAAERLRSVRPVASR